LWILNPTVMLTSVVQNDPVFYLSPRRLAPSGPRFLCAGLKTAARNIKVSSHAGASRPKDYH
jgi:hypothetical protein